ncbi:MAG: hypothetical protein ACTH8H_18475, partial [Serratia proteamaculans]
NVTYTVALPQYKKMLFPASRLSLKPSAQNRCARYAWHGVFIVSGLFWLVVCGFIWFLSSL